MKERVSIIQNNNSIVIIFYFSIAIFSVDPMSGQIILEESLDYEMTQSIEFFIIATDNGAKPLSDNATIIVTVDDTSDNPPYFTKPPSPFEVSIGVPEGNYTIAHKIYTVSRNSSCYGGYLCHIFVVV